jgi:hypothetical protein
VCVEHGFGGNTAKDGRAGVKAPAVVMQGSDTMKSCLLALLCLAPLLIAGCRSDPAIAILERDNYRKGREIDRLKWQIEDLQEALNSSSEQSAGRDRSNDEREPEPKSHRDHRGSNGMKSPETELGTPTNKVPDALKPGISLPTDIPDVPEDIRGPTREKTSGDGPALEGSADRSSPHHARAMMASGSAAVPFRPTGDSRRVRSIAIDPIITGGIGSGDGSGDRGLLVAIQPRDAKGRIVDAPAEVNVTAFDQTLKGEAARVARWDFTPAETAGLFCRTVNGAAIHLAMGWPDRPPKHNKLQLFVRYVTADGRRLEASGPIEIALPGDRTARWTPAETPFPVENPMRAAPPVEREPAASSWRPDERPIARESEPTPYMASGTSEAKPERPVWSPERR